MTQTICPQNGCDLRGEEIPTEYLEKGYYGPWKPEDGPQYYSKVIGVEIRGFYDGVAYWTCPTCGARWHRWTGAGFADMRAKVEEYWKTLDAQGLTE
jgi:hypothetical protein